MTKSSNNKAFYERMNKLAGTDKKNTKANENFTETLIEHTVTDDGTVFGIVKENHYYYIKKSKQKENINESDFAYIGGLENKNKYRFESVSEAEKQLNMFVKTLNEAFSLDSSDDNKEVINEGEDKKVDEKIDKPFDYISGIIKSGKKNISENYEKKFKGSLKESIEADDKATGLMPESALTAIQKAMGKINESEVISTADSEIKDSDKVSEKSGKEEPQAPIDDSNAKTEADKNDGKDSVPAKPSTGNVLVTENEDLITADSEINANESPANQVNATKESAQAPINDKNAKAEADKNDTGDGTTEEAINEPEAIVTESKDIVTADSDIKDSDKVSEKTEHEKPEAPYNAYNQPEKAHKEGDKKGEELKPKESKKDVVAEGEVLSTADSEINDGDVIANKSDKKESAQAPINDTNAKKEADKNNTGDGTTEQPKKESGAIVVENKDITTADSEIKDSDVMSNKSDKKEDSQAPINDKNAKAEADKNDTGDGTTEQPKKESGTIVVENELKEDGNDGEDEIAAAASALDDLEVADVTADAEEEASADIPTETPVDNEIPAEEPAPIETGAEEIPAINGGEEETPAEEPTIDGGEEGTEDDFSKEIQKLVGKLGQTVRDNDVSPDQTKSALNSIISAFKNELGDVEVEDRKEMSDKILKAQGGQEEGGEETEITSTEETEVSAESTASGLEKDAESAIDQKISDLETGGSEEETPVEETVEEEGTCEECGSFDTYMESRGYTNENIGECSAMEMANLISGYANGYNNGQNSGDFEKIAVYLTPEVENELGGYGHQEFIEQLKPFVGGVAEDQKVQFGAIEPTITTFDEDVNEEGNEIEGEENGGEETTTEPEIEDFVVDPNRSIPDVNLVGGAEVMDAGVVKPDGSKTKSVDVDLESGKVNVTMTESEQKLRTYIRNRIDELEGKKKPSLNEDKKSDTLKKLDKKIEGQLDLFKKMINENGNINELFGFSAKEKFQKVNPNDAASVEKLFNDVFRDILINPKMGIIKRLAAQTSPEQKYQIMKQGFETDELKGTLRVAGNELIYAPKEVKDAATHSEFAGGGTQGHTAIGGV